MNPEEHDEELLQEYLAGNSALSRLYRRGAGEQPGADLDARIRGEARHALARRRRVAHGPFSRHWMVPASLAAVLVLSVSIVLLRPEPVSKPGAELDETGGTARDAAGAGQPATAAERAPAAAPSAPSSMEVEQRREPTLDSQLSNAPTGSAGSAPRQTTGKAQAAGETSEAAISERKAEPALRKKSAAEDAQSPAPFAASGDSATRAREESTAVPQPPPMPAASVRRDPQAWLDFIGALLAEHDEAAARSNLRAFRARYPDFPLPSNLSALAASLDAERP